MGPISREGPALALNARHARAVNRACPVLSCPPAQPASCWSLSDRWLTAGTAAGTPAKPHAHAFWRVPRLVCSPESRRPQQVNQTTLIITTLPIVLIQRPPPPNPLITRHRGFACTFHRLLREAGTAWSSDVHISPLHPVLSQSSSATPFCMQAALHQRQAPWLQRKR